MRKDIQHKIMECKTVRSRCDRYERKNAIDVMTAPSRERMVTRSNRWNRWSMINYAFIDRLLEGHLGKNYDRLYADLKRMCTKNRWQTCYVMDYVVRRLNINEPLISHDNRLYFERHFHYSRGVSELSDGDWYVDENRIIQRYKRTKPSKKQQFLKDVKVAQSTEFISSIHNMWFKQIDGVWFVADIGSQHVYYTKIFLYNDSEHFGFRNVLCYRYNRHAFDKNRFDFAMFPKSKVRGSVYDIDREVFVSYDFTAPNNMIAINKRTCPKWMVRCFCKQSDIHDQQTD